jgi:DNA-binding XRE family transcriptional regulator
MNPMEDELMSGKQSTTSFMGWIDEQLDRDPKLRQEVDEALNAMRLEQDLIALREQCGLSQSQLAKLVGVSQPAIAKIESGKIKNLQLKTLLRTAKAMGATVKIQLQRSPQTGMPKSRGNGARTMSRRKKTASRSAA